MARESQRERERSRGVIKKRKDGGREGKGEERSGDERGERGRNVYSEKDSLANILRV